MAEDGSDGAGEEVHIWLVASFIVWGCRSEAADLRLRSEADEKMTR